MSIATHTPRAQCELWQVSHDDYHSDRTAWSHTGLDTFRASRKRFYREYILNDLKREPTDAMQFGILLHMAVLEPERFASQVVVAPKVDRRTKAGKADWESFVAESNGKHVADAEDLDRIRAMTAEIYTNPIAAWLLRLGGVREVSMRWDCRETGLPLKCRLDFLSNRESDGFIVVDLKTTRNASPEAFAKSCFSFGYHRQAAHYTEGVRLLIGELPRFVFVAVGTEPPHEVAVYELDDAAIDLGNEQNTKIKRALSKCLDASDWTAPHENRVNMLSLPRWAYYDDYSDQEPTE